MKDLVKNKVFFIAEISANHCNFNLAKKLVKCAYVNGADAVKLQTYTAYNDNQIDKKYFKVKNGLWKDIVLEFMLKLKLH